MVTVNRRDDRMHFKYHSDSSQDDEEKSIKRPCRRIYVRGVKMSPAGHEFVNAAVMTFG